MKKEPVKKGFKKNIMFDFNNMMAENAGEEHGIQTKDMNSSKPLMKHAINSLMLKKKKGALAFNKVIYSEDHLNDIKKLAVSVRRNCENFVVIGMHGISLGPAALYGSLTNPFTHSFPALYPRFFFIDSADPDLLTGLFLSINIKKTFFYVINQTGATPETIASFMIIREELIKAVGKDHIRDHLIITTDHGKGFLRIISENEKYMILDIPASLNEKFSILSAVGLFPAAVAGIAIDDIIAGAQSMDTLCDNEDYWGNSSYIFALLAFIANTIKKKNILVMMPYCHRCIGISQWFQYLWAESLGKKISRGGEIINAGQTPVTTVGVTDHDAQLQLYLDGPYDKTIIFLAAHTYPSAITIPKITQIPDDLAYLQGHSLNNLNDYHLEATALNLVKNFRLNAKILLPEITPYYIGQLIYFFEMATTLSGELYNVNIFDTHTSDETRKRAHAHVGLKEHTAAKKDNLTQLNQIKRYIIE